MNIITQSKIVSFVLVSYMLTNYPKLSKKLLSLVGHFVPVNMHTRDLITYLPTFCAYACICTLNYLLFVRMRTSRLVYRLDSM